MEKLIAELLRLYLPAGAVTAERVARHVNGQEAPPLALDTADGLTRCIALPFDKAGDSEEAGHWTRLCTVANALQAEHGFPAPAVSVDGVNGYCLWISLDSPVPAAQARRFVEGVRDSYCPGFALRPDAPVLPPCPIPGTGKWAAFIHPGMGVSFADEPALDVAPPPLAQAAFLEGLESVGAAQFAQALQAFEPAAAPPPAPVREAASRPADGLLLRDATLEDIVRHLHAKNIEPTFRHLLP